MPTTDDTHHYFRTEIKGEDVLVVVPTELQPEDIKEIDIYFCSVVEKLRKEYE